MEAYEELENRWEVLHPGFNVAVCSSGTAALHLALEALPKLKEKAEIIIPSYTMISVARAVSLAGYIPVFASVKESDYNIDPVGVESLLTENTAAVIVVHTYGRRADVEGVMAVVGPTVHVIEDLAEAHLGVVPHPHSFAACWSFYKNKIVAGEEGGAVGFRLSYKTEFVRCLRNVGFLRPGRYEHLPRGHNYRLSNLHAKAILENLERYQENLDYRRQLEGLYNRDVPKEFQNTLPRQSPWVYDVFVPYFKDRSWEEIQRRILESCREEDIPARPGFRPIPLQQEYYNCKTNWLWAVAEHRILYFPLQPPHPHISGYATEKTAEKVGLILRKVLES